MLVKAALGLFIMLGAWFGLSDKAGAAVDQNFNWWLDSTNGALHVAADHHTDGSWHVTSHLYEYGTGNYIGPRTSQWFEDWACPSPIPGAAGSAAAELKIRADMDAYLGPNYCTDRGFHSYRPTPRPDYGKPASATPIWGNGGAFKWHYYNCVHDGLKTGLHEEWGNVAYNQDDPCPRYSTFYIQ